VKALDTLRRISCRGRKTHGRRPGIRSCRAPGHRSPRLAEPGTRQTTYGTPGQAAKNGARQATQRNAYRPGNRADGRTAARTNHRVSRARRRTTRSASSPAHLAGDIARSDTFGIAERTVDRHRSDSMRREGLKGAIAARLPLGNTGLKIFGIELGHVTWASKVLLPIK